MKTCKKKTYTIQVYKPKAGTKVRNFLEDADYITSEKQPFVLRGLEGEEWIVDEKKLLTTYVNPDGSMIYADTIGEEPVDIMTNADANTYFCKFVPVDEIIQVKTSWGDVLTANRPEVPHGEGDYIVAMDEGFVDQWIVNGIIFDRIYDIL